MTKLSLFILNTLLLSLPIVSSANECSEGQYFDQSLNRCLLTTKTVENKSEAQDCASLEGDAAIACHEESAANDLQELETDSQVSGATEPEKAKVMVPLLVSLGSAYYLFMNQKALQQCGQTSVWMMLGGGITTLLGEVYTQRAYKKELSSIEKDYDSKIKKNQEIKDEDALQYVSTNQLAAFDYQIAQELARYKAHKKRKQAHSLAATLYGAAAAAAVYEGFTSGWSVATCDAKKNGGGEKSGEDADKTSFHQFNDYYYLERINAAEAMEIVFRQIAANLNFNAYAGLNNITQIGPGYNNTGSQQATSSVTKEVVELQEVTVTAQDTAAAQTGGGAVETGTSSNPIMDTGKDAMEQVKDKMDQVAGSPAFRAAISALLMAHSKTIAKNAGKLANQAKERVEAITEIRNKFAATGGAGFGVCTQDDRLNTSNTNCYCYLSDGSRDPAKENSPTCASVYPPEAADLLSAADYDQKYDYTTLPKANCLSTSGTLDEGCQCENNSCAKLSGNLDLGALKKVPGISSIANAAKGFTDGSFNASSLNPVTTGRARNAFSSIKDQLAKTPESKATLAKVDNLQKKLNDSFNGSIKQKLKSGGFPNSALASGGIAPAATTPLSTTPSSISDSDSKKADSSKSGRNTAGSIARSPQSGFNFGGPQGGVTVQNDETAKDEYDYDYKIDDIADESQNIFNVIHNRYQLSGLKKLFGDEQVNE